MSQDDNEPVYATRGTWRRVIAAVRWVEAQVAGRGGWNRKVPQWTYGVVQAVVTTAIPSGTKTSPSTAGRVRLVHWDGSAWADSGDPVEVVSMMTSSSPVPVGRVVIVGWSGGKWVLVSGSCS